MPDRVAIVSGAAGGVGSAIVRRLTADGLAVGACDMAPTPEAAYHEELDVCDAAAGRRFVARVHDRLGAAEVVVTGAGIQRTGPSAEVTDDDCRRVLDVNLTPDPEIGESDMEGVLSSAVVGGCAVGCVRGAGGAARAEGPVWSTAGSD